MGQLVVIDSQSDIEGLEAYLEDKDLIAYDCETTGLLPTSEIVGISFCAEEDVAFYVILWAWDKDQQKLVEKVPMDVAKRLVSKLVGKSVVCHNAIFDCAMASYYFGVNLIDSLHTDTLVLAHLLNENRKNGLKELAKTFFGDSAANEQVEMKASVTANGGVLTKKVYEMYKADAHLLGKYGAQDALLTFKLFNVLINDLIAQGLEDFFYVEESMPLLRGPTYTLNTTGLRVDAKALTTLKQTLKAECAEARAFIYSEIDSHIKAKYPGTSKKTSFNVESNVQLSWLLFGELGLEFGLLTKEGKTVCKALGLKIPYSPGAKREFIATCLESVGQVYAPEGVNAKTGKKTRAKKVKEPWCYIAADKKTLTKFAKKLQWVEALLKYKKNIKILTTYVEGIEQRLQYGIIRPSFLQHGTTSGRYASRDPNFQNLPRDDKRVKACIIPRPNRVFVGADYSQLEPRVFAYYSKDERLMAAFNGDDDFYSVIGIDTFDKYDAVPKKEGPENAFGTKYKALRDASKVVALASTYGITAHNLAPSTGKSVEDTQKIIDRYFEKFPKVKQLQLDSHELAKKQGFVTNLFGRKRRIPEAKLINKIYGRATPHDELPYEARKLLNVSINHRIQSTGASIVNRAAIRFTELTKEAGINCALVLQVHDSFIVECDKNDAENVSILLQEAMENTVLLEGVPLEAVPKIGDNLASV